MESTNELCQRWQSTQARTAALDNMIHDVKRHCNSLEEGLSTYQATVEQALNILNLSDEELSKDEKLMTIKELLGLVYSGQILHLDQFLERAPVEIGHADLTEGLVLADEFDVSLGT